jgi:chitinase
MYSADEAVKYLYSKGVDHSRLVMGAPIYGRSWSNVNCNSGEFGLFQSGSADSAGTWEAGVYDYKDILQHYKTDSNYHFHD